MAATKKAARAATKTAARTERQSSGDDPIASLVADHRKVKALFKEFASLKEEDGDSEEKQRLVRQICLALKVHATLEEEIFYPAVRERIDDEDLMDEAVVEHASAKDLIAQLESMDSEDDLYDAKVTVLGEQIDHHVEEEEGEMFPKARKAKVNTPELAAEMQTRREELIAELGAEEEEAEA